MTGTLTQVQTSTLCRLSGVLRYYELDTEAGGREALRVLQMAGLHWTNLLGEPAEGQQTHLRQAVAFGYRFLRLREYGAVISLLAARATPFQLAHAATLCNLRAPTQHQVDALASLAQMLISTSLEPTPASGTGGYFGPSPVH